MQGVKPCMILKSYLKIIVLAFKGGGDDAVMPLMVSSLHTCTRRPTTMSAALPPTNLAPVLSNGMPLEYCPMVIPLPTLNTLAETISLISAPTEMRPEQLSGPGLGIVTVLLGVVVGTVAVGTGVVTVPVTVVVTVPVTVPVGVGVVVVVLGTVGDTGSSDKIGLPLQVPLSPLAGPVNVPV
jgi:hypothetical protein